MTHHSLAQSRKLKRSAMDFPSAILVQLLAKSFDLSATRDNAAF